METNKKMKFVKITIFLSILKFIRGDYSECYKEKGNFIRCSDFPMAYTFCENGVNDNTMDTTKEFYIDYCCM